MGYGLSASPKSHVLWTWSPVWRCCGSRTFYNRDPNERSMGSPLLEGVHADLIECVLMRTVLFCFLNEVRLSSERGPLSTWPFPFPFLCHIVIQPGGPSLEVKYIGPPDLRLSESKTISNIICFLSQYPASEILLQQHKVNWYHPLAHIYLISKSSVVHASYSLVPISIMSPRYGPMWYLVKRTGDQDSC